MHDPIRSCLLAVALATLFTTGVSAASDQGHLSTDAAALQRLSADDSAREPNEKTPKVITHHGVWTAYTRDTVTFIVDQFNDNASFGIVYGNGEVGLILYSPEWKLKKGDTLLTVVDVDGKTYSGRAEAMNENAAILSNVGSALVDSIYASDRVEIMSKGDTFLMTTLKDAAAVLADLKKEGKIATD
jgi:hypothetical protein